LRLRVTCEVRVLSVPQPSDGGDDLGFDRFGDVHEEFFLSHGSPSQDVRTSIGYVLGLVCVRGSRHSDSSKIGLTHRRVTAR
jgi:hypothetical protein